ncbi:general transcription factor 3C polypeptide 6 isoform X2 [Strongylocentrotus purpuratus]|uniref:Transcription factor TFIIIC triple barrel domain-containing protein n=1 Tax=Strongylocentrotus purpuratus TaxID=7668 RepID=A0A7M7SSH6_STRPU|nr:general transcription factor 3C polypeptide 6 isoform X2 [Strongylocentrotus purpuratus]
MQIKNEHERLHAASSRARVTRIDYLLLAYDFQLLTMAKSEASDGEWVEEEHLMLVELTGVLDYQYFAKSDKVCKLLGIGTENPVLQIGNYVFKGEYKKTVGTAVFFEQDEQETGSQTTSMDVTEAEDGT